MLYFAHLAILFVICSIELLQIFGFLSVGCADFYSYNIWAIQPFDKKI